MTCKAEKLIGYLEGIITEERRGFFSAILKSKLLLLSWMCLTIVKFRRWLYSRGILRSRRLPCKVISIGNVVAGGSGKTPAVMAIAAMLKDCMGLKVGVLSRGYQSRIRGLAVVSDGKDIFLNPVDAGDEPYLLARKLRGIPVLIGKDRFKTGLMAFRELDCQIIILDDGFQYLRLARDVDIITVDATRPFGFDHILPRGYLRESLSTLKRADLILLTRVDQCKHLDFVYDRLARIATSVPIFESIHRPRAFYSLDEHQEFGLDIIQGKNILAVCGISNPGSFVETLRSLDPAKVDLLSFPDHHKYPPSSIEGIRRRVAESDVDMIVFTEKDGLKLNAIADYPALVLKVELELVGTSAKSFIEFVGQRCGL